MQNQLLNSRISLFSVAAGAVLTLALMFMLMSLAAALGFWNYRPDDLPVPERQFWTVASLAWMTSVFVGSIFVAVVARSQQMKDGIINAIAVWAASYLFFGGVSLAAANMHRNSLSIWAIPETSIYWQCFVGDAAAFFLAVAGAVVGTAFERGYFRIKKKTEEKKYYSYSQATLESPSLKKTGRIRLFILAALLLLSGIQLNKWWSQVGLIILVIMFVESFFYYKSLGRR